MFLVLDASAVLNEPNFSFEEGKNYVVTPLVRKEFRSMESRLLVENAEAHGQLSVRTPKKEFADKAKAMIKEHGFKISKPDESVLALGLELKSDKEEFLVLTDDFSIQNFLELAGVPFSSVIQGEIKQVFSFSKKCVVCGKKFPRKKNNCPDCGVPLKSVVKKKPI